jgi:hypothetical protein
VEQSPHQICSPISPGSLCRANGQSFDSGHPFSGHAKEESNYKRLQRFLREFEMPYAELALFIVKLLGVPGPYTLALDRTNWKVGAVDLNILMLSIVYREVGIPVVWTVCPKRAIPTPANGRR